MNTSERLEAMIDERKFERLATSLLHKANKDYARLLHPGINAKGKTRKSRLDIYGVVPGSVPPRFLLGEHTITEKKGLKRKWLHDHTTAKSSKSASASNDGDLLKICRKAEQLKKRFRDAKFTIILTTNIRPPVDLVDAVYEKAAEFGFSPSDIDIWDQSRIAYFLDTNPEGQYLRQNKEYLGIEAEILSNSLLRNLCQQSLANYEKQFLTSPNSWVPREIDSQVEKGTYSNTYTIQLLIGESGCGKSAAAYQILKKHLGSGGYGLWISDELLKECTLIENAIDRALRELYPSLLPDAGRAALRLIPEGSRLLLIVDDVNRANNPPRQVENLVSWSKPKQSEPSDSPSSFSPYLVVCHVLPQILGSISRDLKETTWVNNIFISSMTSAEGMVAVQATTSDAGMEITNTEAISLATSLGNDPILIGLFGSLLSSTPPCQPCELNSLTENVVERFIKTTIKQVSSSQSALLEIEYRDALSTLTTFMLKNRRLFPLWKEIRDWFRESPDELSALRDLTGHEKLCRLTTERKFVFRHDRIQQALLVESMIELLAKITSDSEILYEPFYAEIIGRAIARSPQSKEFLQEMRNRLPLALVEAIRCFGNLTTNYHQTILGEIKEWVSSAIVTGSAPGSVLDAVFGSLLETKSLAVLEITEKLPQRWTDILLARFRNGCTVSGVCYCSLGQNDFKPRYKYKLRDQVFEQAKHYYREKILRELKQLLTSSAATDKDREGALTLAGFLGFSELENEIATCWNLVRNKAQILPNAIWAAIHCCGTQSKKLLDPLMTYWSELPDEKDEYGHSHKSWFVRKLRFALARGIRDDVVNYLIAQCNVHQSLREHITYICDLIDAADAIEFIVRSAADIDRSLAGTGKFSAWTLTLTNNWDAFLEGDRRLSQTSMMRLESLWKESKNDDLVKQQAFRRWLTGVEWEHIEILRAIPSNSIVFRGALWKRIQLGDRSAVPDLLPFLSEEPDWFEVAHHVWCNELMVIAHHYLEVFNDNSKTKANLDRLSKTQYNLSRLLTMIPVKDAEMLLNRYWDNLGYGIWSDKFIQAALYVGTSKCLELAASSISQHSTDWLKDIVFRNLSSIFGFWESERSKYMSVKHLENLLPYLDYLDESELGNLALVCQNIGIPEWSKQYLYPRLSENSRKRYHPSEDDLLQNLNEFAATPYINGIHYGVQLVPHWLEEFDKRHDLKSRALSIVDCWLAFNPTIKGLQIASACVQAVGTRRDLSILEQYTIEGSPDEIARIKESTRFAVYRRSLD